MIIGVGIDIIEVERIKKAIETYGEHFLKRIFTENEIKYCEEFKDKKYVHYAVRFSAKEAFSKAIGTGITQGFKFNQVGILNENSGKPVVVLSGELLEKWGKYRIYVSLSHINETAASVVIIEE